MKFKQIEACHPGYRVEVVGTSGPLTLAIFETAEEARNYADTLVMPYKRHVPQLLAGLEDVMKACGL